MQHAAKFAVSLPNDEFQEIEQIRENMGVGRSAIIRQAVHFWLEQRKKNQKIRLYEKGYKKIPEKIEEFQILEMVQMGTFNSEESW